MTNLDPQVLAVASLARSAAAPDSRLPLAKTLRRVTTTTSRWDRELHPRPQKQQQKIHLVLLIQGRRDRPSLELPRRVCFYPVGAKVIFLLEECAGEGEGEGDG